MKVIRLNIVIILLLSSMSTTIKYSYIFFTLASPLIYFHPPSPNGFYTVEQERSLNLSCFWDPNVYPPVQHFIFNPGQTTDFSRYHFIMGSALYCLVWIQSVHILGLVKEDFKYLKMDGTFYSLVLKTLIFFNSSMHNHNMMVNILVQLTLLMKMMMKLKIMYQLKF